MRYLFLVFIFLASLTITAQIEDDFSDGNFTSNPVWDGDVLNFEVDEDNKLHLNAPEEIAVSNIFTESQEIDDVYGSLMLKWILILLVPV